VSSPILQLDTLDDRREMWHLLHRLPPRARVRFLAGQCAKVRARDPRGNGPVPGGSRHLAAAYREDGADYRLTNEVYADLLVLAAQWGLDLAAAAAELMAAVRRPSAPAPPSSPRGSAAARTPCSRC